MNLPLAITLGDPAGIGPEIIAKAFLQAPDDMAGCFVAGDVALLRRACHVVAPDVALPVVDQGGRIVGEIDRAIVMHAMQSRT